MTDGTPDPGGSSDLHRLLSLSDADTASLLGFVPAYGNLSDLNPGGLIQRATGTEVLQDIVSDFLRLLGTSAAVYERDGSYAIGIFSSGWCQLLDESSRLLCDCEDNRDALSSGQWLCHESCWSDASLRAIETRAPTDIECHGGLRLHAVPILANDEVVGAINFGYGDPPADAGALAAIADKYRIDVDTLRARATAYERRPEVIINLARLRLAAAARMIGAMVERFQAERLARESEAHLRDLFTAMDEGFALHEIICDAAGTPVDYRFIDVNPAFEKMTGLVRAELIGRTVKEVLPGTEDFWIDRYGRVALTGEAVSFDAPAAPLDRHYSVHAYCPRRGRFAVVFSDITDRVRAAEDRLRVERRIMQAQKLESLGVLAGGIAHDFNNILMAILGLADLSMGDAPSGSHLRENLSSITDAARRASELCRQMLAYAGKGQHLPGPQRLNRLIEEMRQLLQMSISKNVVLNLRLAGQLPEAHGDASQIRQVLMNLVINASEAIGDQSGVVTISTGAMDCSEAYLRETCVYADVPPGPYVYIEVSDTGCGMSRETQQRIFEPFFSTKFAGRGLGMSTVLGIVQSHRGALKLYSETDNGSTFKILLPISGEQSTEPDGRSGAARTAPAWRGSGTVLTVDDEETNVALTKLMLTRLGFDVLTAPDGREAVRIYQERHDEICLVLMDLTMPHMNGDEAFRQLKLINPDVRVILTSGYTEHEINSRFAGKGLAGFLEKPFTKGDLLRLIRETLPDAG